MGLLHYSDDRLGVFHCDRGECSRHQREVERHVAFVTCSEIIPCLIWPLVCFCKEYDAGVVRLERLSDVLEQPVRFRKILVISVLSLNEIRNGIEAKAVHAKIEPEAHDIQNRFDDRGVVIVQIRLMGVEAMPEIGVRNGVPGPVGSFAIDENDAPFRELVVRLGLDVEIPLRGPGSRVPGTLKPGMLIGSMVENQLRNDMHLAGMGGIHQPPEIVECTEFRTDAFIVEHVVAVVPARRRIERQEPDCIDAERCQVIQLPRQSGKIAESIPIGIEERLYMELVDDSILMPGCIAKLAFGFAQSSAPSATIVSARRDWFWRKTNVASHLFKIAQGKSTARRRCSLP